VGFRHSFLRAYSICGKWQYLTENGEKVMLFLVILSVVEMAFCKG